jgi:hypothetical protein
MPSSVLATSSGSAYDSRASLPERTARGELFGRLLSGDLAGQRLLLLEDGLGLLGPDLRLGLDLGLLELELRLALLAELVS